MKRPKLALVAMLAVLGIFLFSPALADWQKMDPPPDVDKSFHNHAGTSTCWLATAANMLAGAGYGTGATVQARANSIYLQLVANYGTGGGWTDTAITWWLGSANNTQPGNPYDVVTVYGNKSPKYPWANSNGARFVGNELRRCQYLGLSISWPTSGSSVGSGGHAITCWGDSGGSANLTANPARVKVTDSDRDTGGDVQTYTYDSYTNPNPGGANEGNGWYINYSTNHPYIKHIITLCPTDDPGDNTQTQKVVGSYKIHQNNQLFNATDLHYKVGTDTTILSYKTTIDWSTGNSPQIIENGPPLTELDVYWNLTDNLVPYCTDVTITTEFVLPVYNAIYYKDVYFTYPDSGLIFPGFKWEMYTPILVETNVENITGGYVVGAFDLLTTDTNTGSLIATGEYRFLHEYDYDQNPEQHTFTLLPEEISGESYASNLRFGHSYGILDANSLWEFDDWMTRNPDVSRLDPGIPITMELDWQGQLPYPAGEDYIGQFEPPVCIPYFRIDTEEEWLNALSSGEISPMEPGMEPGQWGDYMKQWTDWTKEGNTYPDNEFIPPLPPDGNLYVYGGGGAGGTEPNDAGFVMVWGNESTMVEGDYASAFNFTPLDDPDYSNCTVTVMVTAPQITLIPPHVQMNQVSLGLQDINGNIRAWYWNCPNPIPHNVPTQISIDCSQTGMGAANPTATGYMNNPGFDITQVVSIIVDENGNWVPGAVVAPAPGSGMVGLWNYWHWLMVSPNTTVEKGIYKKWSQPPIVIDPNDPPIIEGWDEYSDYNLPVVADDWACKDDRPVTDIHWWGSWLGWNQPHPPQLPSAFHIGIWTDVPDPNVNDPTTFSHPGTLIWENYCDNYVWNFAGYDSDPRQYKDAAGGPTGVPPAGTADEPNDSCFQFTQLLSEDEWFYQEPNENEPNGTIYWLSIAPIWPTGEDPIYQWGWKTRRHYFQDDAVSMQPAPWWPPVVGTTTCPASAATPIKFPPFPDPDSLTWDMAFELTTNEPAYEDNPIPGDSNLDGVFDFKDLAITLAHWLERAPGF